MRAGTGREEAAMTAPLSLDLRIRIRRAVEAGSSMRQAAKRFDVSPSAVIKLMRRVRQTGSTAPAKIGGYRDPVLKDHAGLIGGLVRERPHITLAELQAALRQRGIVVHALSTIWLMLRRLGLSHKKTR
jgi:transposase